MARKLKTYQTSLGFFDLAIAAPSMKAVLEAWGRTAIFSTRARRRKVTSIPVQAHFAASVQWYCADDRRRGYAKWLVK
jgi:hypothetical protein